MHRSIEPDTETNAAPDRHATGGQNDASPTLDPLLREITGGGLHNPQDDDESDQLASARGIVIWVFISAVLLALSVLLVNVI
jgi:hypothetical protein